MTLISRPPPPYRPLMDAILRMLGKAKYLTALDLKSGYKQVKLEDSSKENKISHCFRNLNRVARICSPMNST